MSIIIAAVLVILGGGGAAAYYFWYENPDKVITDGIVNALKAKTIKYTGTISMSGDMKIKLELTGANTLSTSDLTAKATFAIAGKDYSLDSSARFDDKGDLYLKLKNIDSVVSAYRATLPGGIVTPQMSDLTNKLAAKINDRWIKVSADDLSTFSEDASKTQKCSTDAAKKYQNDQKAITQISDAYKKNKFIVVDQNLGSQNGSLGYILKGDEKALRSFLVDLKNTEIYKTLHDCDTSFTIDDKDLPTVKNDKANGRLELWVDSWTHKITKVVGTSNNKDTKTQLDIVFQPIFDEKVEVKAPDNSITLKQLQDDIEELIIESFTAASELTPEEAAMIPPLSEDTANHI